MILKEEVMVLQKRLEVHQAERNELTELIKKLYESGAYSLGERSYINLCLGTVEDPSHYFHLKKRGVDCDFQFHPDEAFQLYKYLAIYFGPLCEDGEEDAA